MREFIAYRRVTTAEGRRSPGALEAQALAILQFVQSEQGVLLRDFLEREPGRGSDALERRAQLQRAMQLAKERQAVLVVSTLDRLSRDVATLSRLVESGLEFVAAETPTADAFMLQIYAEVVQRSREHIARRISSTLQAKKRTARSGPAESAGQRGNAAAAQPEAPGECGSVRRTPGTDPERLPQSGNDAAPDGRGVEPPGCQDR
jgi:DNA invertase Pin-like site-specific DNA recombinase